MVVSHFRSDNTEFQMIPKPNGRIPHCSHKSRRALWIGVRRNALYSAETILQNTLPIEVSGVQLPDLVQLSRGLLKLQYSITHCNETSCRYEDKAADSACRLQSCDSCLNLFLGHSSRFLVSGFLDFWFFWISGFLDFWSFHIFCSVLEYSQLTLTAIV